MSFLKKLSVLAVLVVALLCASPAQAAITIAISTDGGATFGGPFGVTASGGESATIFSASATSAGGTTISVTATTNQPFNAAGMAGFAQVSQVNINISGVAPDAIPLVVRISDIDFALPVGPSLLSSSFSTSIGASGGILPIATSAGTFQSVADFNSGVLFGGLPGVPGSAPPGSEATTGLQPFLVAPLVNLTTSASGDASVTTFATAPFSLSNEFRFALLTIAGGGQSLQFTGTTSLTALPAPAGVVLALTALPVLGFGHWLRRRRTQVKPV